MRISCPAFKVYLESVDREDAEAIAEYSNDYEIASNVPNMPFPYTIEHAVSFVEFAELRCTEKVDFHMSVRLKGGEFIGMCAIANIDSTNMRADIGYWIGRRHWEKGYGKEAVRLMLHFAFETLRLNRICAKVLVGNERSIRLLGALGFKKEGTAREEVFHMGKFMDDDSFGIVRSEYADNARISVEGYG
ncbi:MAG: GNAT family N-acetyltransferase [Candidatus Micrarchaeaceae archaeon]|nr:GNAT family N-acetyltransferase [Candidatus Micrarchaeota archaeon]HII10008.1 GNAT family N-acetyltransferase [Candidatus Micrarchaeota archaeon]